MTKLLSNFLEFLLGRLSAREHRAADCPDGADDAEGAANGDGATSTRATCGTDDEKQGDAARHAHVRRLGDRELAPLDVEVDLKGIEEAGELL
jgi:hypothetical protein